MFGLFSFFISLRKKSGGKANTPLWEDNEMRTAHVTLTLTLLMESEEIYIHRSFFTLVHAFGPSPMSINRVQGNYRRTHINIFMENKQDSLRNSLHALTFVLPWVSECQRLIRTEFVIICSLPNCCFRWEPTSN